jgi:sugar phosphate isomerase/epimerase
MRIGIFAKIFVGESLNAILDQVAQNDFETVQFNMACAGLNSLPDEYPNDVLLSIKNSLSQHNLSVTALSGTFNMAHPIVEEREDGLKRLCLMMENVKEISTDIITICTGSKDPSNMWRYHPDNNSKATWSDLCKTLEKALAKAEQEKIILAFEPEANNVVSSADKGFELLKEMRSNYLKVVFDPANLFEKGSAEEIQGIIEHALSLLYEHTVIVHAKDRLADGQFVPAGKGELPYSFLLNFLKEHKYQGDIIVHELKPSEAKGSSKFLKSLL